MKCNVLNIDNQDVVLNYYTLQKKKRFSKHPTNNNVMCVREKYVHLCACVILCVMCNVYTYMPVIP
jgi:hypothetical protein